MKSLKIPPQKKSKKWSTWFVHNPLGEANNNFPCYKPPNLGEAQASKLHWFHTPCL